MTRTEMKKINRIIFKDYSEYDSDKCHDGGAYGFWTDFYRSESNTDVWEMMYHTTADFGCCPCCGDFGDEHWDGGEAGFESGYSCGEFDTLTTDELLERINSSETDEDGTWWEFE